MFLSLRTPLSHMPINQYYNIHMAHIQILNYIFGEQGGILVGFLYCKLCKSFDKARGWQLMKCIIYKRLRFPLAAFGSATITICLGTLSDQNLLPETDRNTRSTHVSSYLYYLSPIKMCIFFRQLPKVGVRLCTDVTQGKGNYDVVNTISMLAWSYGSASIKGKPVGNIKFFKIYNFHL